METKRRLNRRDFLRLSAAAATGAVVAACAPTAPQVVEKVVKETVVVEKEVAVEKEVVKEVPVEKVVEKVVEKPVEVVKEVEKVVIATPKPGEKAKLTFQARAREVVGKAVWEEMGPIFHTDNPDIEVTYSPTPDQYMEKMLAAIVAGNAPDIIGVCCYWGPLFMQKGQTIDLQPYIDRDITDAMWQDWDPQQFERWRYPDNDHVHLMPKYLGNEVIFWNIEMFDEVGVDHMPEKWPDSLSYDDYADVMNQLTRVENTPNDRWGAWGGHVWGDRVQMHLNGWGGHFVNPDDTDECWLGTEESQACLEWIRAGIWDDNRYVRPDQAATFEWQGGNLFPANKVGMIEEGSWQIRPMSERCKFKWNVAPYPKGPVDQVTMDTIDGWFAWSGSKYPDACWELMNFLASIEYGRSLCKIAFLQPARLSNYSYWFRIMRETFPQLEDVRLETWGEVGQLGIGRTEEIFTCHNESRRDVLDPVFDQVMKVGDTPVSAFIEASEQVTALNRAGCA
jgi:multiple sugar transport system substrate-binding protein